VSLGNSTTIKPSTAITIEARIKPVSWNSATTQVIISNFDTAGYRLQLANGQLTGIVYRNGVSATVTYNASAFTGWHSISLIYTGQILRLYTDQTLRNSNDAGAAYVLRYTTGKNTMIGCSHDSSSGYFNGRIDEVRIWRDTARVPTTTTIVTEVLPTTTKLVANYRFNSGVADSINSGLITLTDLTSGINGTLKNFALNDTVSNWVAGYPLRPVDRSTALTFTNRTQTGFTINWTRPGANKGGNFVKVFLLLGTTAIPAFSATTNFPANAAFGDPLTEIVASSGYYCVYSGNGTSVNVTNLINSSQYRAYVYEYQISSNLTQRSAINSNSLGYTDFVAPTSQDGSLSISNVNGTSFTANWVRGNGSTSIVFVKQDVSDTAHPVYHATYTANTIFKSGTQIPGTGWYCVYKNTGNTVTVTGLTAGLPYQVMVCGFNGIAGLENYNTTVTTNLLNQATDYNLPTRQATGVNFTNIVGSTLTVNFTKGDGANSIVFMKKTSTDTLPYPSNNTTIPFTYNAANNLFGAGTQIGTTGWYCVYKGAASTFNITGRLYGGLTYKVKVLSYNGTSGYEKYLTKDTLNNPVTITMPNVQAHDISYTAVNGNRFTINWIRGNDSCHIVIVKKDSVGRVSPRNDTTFTANTVFPAANTQWRNSGWYCVYKGTAAAVTVTNLLPGETYRTMVLGYNGTAGHEIYNTDSVTLNPANQRTDYFAPTIQASNLSFSLVTNNSFRLAWTNGNGSTRVVFVAQTDTGKARPYNDSTYLASATFTAGTQIGTTGWYCVYRNTGSAVTVTGLTAGKNYKAVVYEFNGTTGFQKYLTDTLTNIGKQKPDYLVPNGTAKDIILTPIAPIGSNFRFTASWTRGNGTYRLVVVKLGTTGSPQLRNDSTVNANSTFGTSGFQIGNTGWYCVSKAVSTTTTATIQGLTLGQNYRAKVIEYNGTAGVEKYLLSDTTNNPVNGKADYPVPTTQASNINFSVINPNDFTANWTRGNGSYCLVFVKQTNVGTAIPGNDSIFTANTVFGLGTQIGSTGWYCVYNGTGTSVSVTGLSSGLPYQVMVCEFNGTPSSYPTYLTTSASNNPNNIITFYPTPTKQASNIVISNYTTSTITPNWTRGDGSNCLVFASNTTTGSPTLTDSTTYAANAAFGSGSPVGSWYCVYKGVSNTVTVTGLNIGLTYRFKVFEMNGSNGYERYKKNDTTGNPVNQKADYMTPTIQAKIIGFSSVGYTSFIANWQRGNGARVAVFIKDTTVTSPAPVDDTTYTANAAYKLGKQIGSTGWYCIYDGTGTSVTITALIPGHTYRVKACEYNGTITQYHKYLLADAASNPNNQITTDYATPAGQASNIVLSNPTSTSITATWTNATGTARAVFVRQADTLIANPINNTTYSANAAYGSGATMGGGYCVYNGTGTTVTVTGLTFGQTYWFRVYNYNGTTLAEKYNVTKATNNPNSKTLSTPAPTTQAAGVVFSNVNSSAFTVNWTRGNGDSCAVFIKSVVTTGNPAPLNNTTYTANNTYSLGTQISSTGWYCIYNGTGTNVNVNGLTALTNYRVMVCEYNGGPGVQTYLTNSGTNNPANQTTDANFPSTQASNITFTNLAFPARSNSMQFSWTRGNGSKCAVFVAQTSSGAANPTNNSSYTASTTFLSGTQIGATGWYCVFNGSGTGVTVTNLQPGKYYRAMVCEYFGNPGGEKYNANVAAGNPANRATDVIDPTTQASNLVLSNIQTNSISAIWTKTIGDSCIVFVSTDTLSAPAPVENANYIANSTYHNGSSIGSWYCVYKGTGTTTAVTGLSAGTYYRFVVFIYNGIANYRKYLTTITSNAKVGLTQFNAPSTQAYGIVTEYNDPNSRIIRWRKGNGAVTAVFVKQASAGSAVPVNGTTYYGLSTFTNGTQIGGTGWYCVYNGTDTTVTVTGLATGTDYTVMACSYNGIAGMQTYNILAATNNPVTFNIMYLAPSTQAHHIVFTQKTTHSTRISWTRGNGMNCAVFMSYSDTTGSAIAYEDNTYNANSFFSLGDQIGTSGWYCVYKGNNNTVVVNGLTPRKKYRAMVIEYNGVTGSEKYLSSTATINPLNVTMNFAGPTTQAHSILFSDIISTAFTVSWTRGNGAGCMVFASVGSAGSALVSDSTSYTANTSFGLGTQVGSTGWYCIYKGVGSTTSIVGMIPHTAYNIMVCEYSGIDGSQRFNADNASNNPKSQITSYELPSSQASNLNFTDVGSTGFTLNWTNGDGEHRIVFLKAATDGSPVPVNNVLYNASSVYPSGTQIGSTGWYCVYSGSGSSVAITGLTANNDYRAMVLEYNGNSGSQKYNIATATGNPANQKTNVTGTASQASNILFSNVSDNGISLSWTRGSGDACAVFMKNTGSGNAVPVNNTAYTGNTIFASGTQIGSSGWYCVYNGTGTTVSVTGLTSASTYRAMVCEYSGTLFNVNTATGNPNVALTTPITTWTGSSWDNGSPTSTVAAHVASNFSDASNISCNSLLINTGVTMTIQPGNNVTVETDLTNNGTFILASPTSSMAAAGSLITKKAISNNGTMTAQRYISPGTLAADNYTWHFMSAPIAEYRAELTFTNDYVLDLIESSNDWLGLNMGDLLLPGKGVIVKTINPTGKTVNFTGSFNTGSYTLNLANSSATDNNGYNLVGNPYPSSIDWNASGWGKNNLSTTIWIWNPTAAGGVGDYATYNNPVNTNGGSNLIPPTQGFMVQVAPGNYTGSITFTDAVRVHSSMTSMKQSTQPASLIRLSVKGDKYSDECVIYKADGENTAFKLFSPHRFVPQIYVSNNDKEYALFKVPIPTVSKTVNLGFINQTEGIFEIGATELGINDKMSYYLIDKMTYDTVALTLGSKYVFSHNPESQKERFELVVSANKLLSKDASVDATYQNISIWSNKNKVLIALPNYDPYTVSLFDMLGKSMGYQLIKNKGINEIEVLKKGIYIVRVTGLDGTYSKKVMIH
jgi:hypothetical protein